MQPQIAWLSKKSCQLQGAKPTSAFYGDIIDYTPDDIPDSYWHEFKYYRHQPDWLHQAAAKAGVQMEILGQLRPCFASVN